MLNSSCLAKTSYLGVIYVFSITETAIVWQKYCFLCLVNLLQKLILPCSLSPRGERIASPTAEIASWTTSFSFLSWTSSFHSLIGIKRCDSGRCKTDVELHREPGNHVEEAPVSSFSWESGGPIHQDLCAKITWDIFDRELRIWGATQESIHARGYSPKPDVLITACSIRLPSLPSVLLYMKRQWELCVLSSSRHVQSFTLLCACMHAPCVPPHLGLCAALVLLKISQVFSVFFFFFPCYTKVFCSMAVLFPMQWFSSSPLLENTEACI